MAHTGDAGPPGYWSALASRATTALVSETNKALGGSVSVAAQRAAVEHLCATLLPAELQATADSRSVAPYKLEDLAKAEGVRAFVTALAADVRGALATRVAAKGDTPEALYERLLLHGTRLMLLKLPADLLRAWVNLSGGAVNASRNDQASALAAYIFAPPPPAPAAPPLASQHHALDASELYCDCRQPHGGRFMIGCDGCEEWYHGDCVGIREADVPNTPDYRWYCKTCHRKGKARAPSAESGSFTGDVKKRERIDSETVQLTVDAQGERFDLRAQLSNANAQRLQALLSAPSVSVSSVTLTSSSPALHILLRLAASPSASNNDNPSNNNNNNNGTSDHTKPVPLAAPPPGDQ